MNSWIYLVAAICMIVIPVMGMLMLSPASQNVAVWVFQMDDTGTRHFIGRLPATEDASGTLTFSRAGADSHSLPAGKYWLVIEHPGSDGSYRLILDGSSVKSQSLNTPNDGMQLFRVSGPGSLQSEDAYWALMAAYDDIYATAGTTAQTANGDVTEREYVIE
ncbi:MAG: hypothetical protein LUQ01_05630 [Methanolinea sp.]|nr:hypothetical protein [Methanolinea sp.]